MMAIPTSWQLVTYTLCAATVLAAAPTPSVTGALGPNGVLSPSANLIPTLAPGPSALLRELYPALAPAVSFHPSIEQPCIL